MYLLQLEALCRRIRANHPNKQKVEEELRKQKAGYRGEKTLDYYLSYLPKEKSLILNNLRLPYKQNFFQMDTLILTKRYFLIIESKNYAGELFYHVLTNQLTRFLTEQEDVFEDPVAQVERQKIQLLYTLQAMKQPVIPVLTLVAFTNSSASLKTIPEHMKAPKNLIRVEALPIKLAEIDRIHKKEYINEQQLKRVAKQLIKRDVPYFADIQEKFGAEWDDLKKGVHCPNCLVFSIERLDSGYWQCRSCGYKSLDAYKYTLNDYYLLKDIKITNRQFREFVGVGSTKAAMRMLARLKLEKSGKGKLTSYSIPLFKDKCK